LEQLVNVKFFLTFPLKNFKHCLIELLQIPLRTNELEYLLMVNWNIFAIIRVINHHQSAAFCALLDHG
jgi:hypothetical protein